MASFFRAKLLMVDDFPRGPGPGLSHRSLPRQEFAAGDRNLLSTLIAQAPGQLSLIDRTFLPSEVFLFRGVATADREWSRK